MRYAIALTSIPPRFARLGPVLRGLLAQKPAPVRVFLSLPRRYRRFDCDVTPPHCPKGVELLWNDRDRGPATKALMPAKLLAGQGMRLIYCDDDWLYPVGWAAALLSSVGRDTHAQKLASTGQAWDIARVGRRGTGCDIAQGFSGVCVDPDWLTGDAADPPEDAWSADDVWLSGVLAHRGVSLRACPAARASLRPAYTDTHGLQDVTAPGQTRDAANRAALKAVHDRFGIWPPLH